MTYVIAAICGALVGAFLIGSSPRRPTRREVYIAMAFYACLTLLMAGIVDVFI